MQDYKEIDGHSKDCGIDQHHNHPYLVSKCDMTCANDEQSERRRVTPEPMHFFANSKLQ
jgi:hypothetical protein